MQRDARYTTSDIVTMFAHQGVAVSTIARAMAIPTERVDGMCRRAIEHGTLAMMPPATPADTRHALLSEVTNLRAKLDDAQAMLRESAQKTKFHPYAGVLGMTRKEAGVIAAIARHGQATKSAIYNAIYNDVSDDDVVEPKIIDVFICKARKKLKRGSIAVHTIWGVGYGMSADSIEKLNALANARWMSESPSIVPELEAA